MTLPRRQKRARERPARAGWAALRLLTSPIPFYDRRISDRLEEKLTRTQFTPDDKTFIESAPYFFLATADAEARPDCSFKGGMPGFVRVTGPSELAFPITTGTACLKVWANSRQSQRWDTVYCRAWQTVSTARDAKMDKGHILKK